MRVSVVIPSVHRPALLCRAVESVLKTAPSAEIVCSLSRGDTASGIAMRDLRVAGLVRVTASHASLTGAVVAVNEGAWAATGEALAFIGDDCIAHPGWLEEAMRILTTLPQSCGVVGLNDLARGPRDGHRFATHHLATRSYLDRFNSGEFWHSGYVHYYGDVELCERASALGRYVWCASAIVRHDRDPRNPVTGAAFRWYARDQHLYEARTQEFKSDHHDQPTPAIVVH